MRSPSNPGPLSDSAGRERSFWAVLSITSPLICTMVAVVFAFGGGGQGGNPMALLAGAALAMSSAIGFAVLSLLKRERLRYFAVIGIILGALPSLIITDALLTFRWPF